MCQVVEEYAEEVAKEKIIQIAINAINKKLSDEDIADMTGLTVEEVSELRRSL